MFLFLFFIVTLSLSLITDAQTSWVGSRYFPGFFNKPKPSTGMRLVVGGKPSAAGDWPWQAAVYLKDKGVYGFQCGASIIDKRLLLCAAHCFYDNNGSRIDDSMFKFALGTHNLKEKPKGFQQFSAAQIILHFRYNPAEFDFDIALVQLNKDIQYGPTVQPIMLAERDPLDGEKCFVTGFGRTNTESNEGSVELMEVALPVVSRQTCSEQWGQDNLEITQGMLCAGFPEGGKASCNGDSGGPFACNATGKWILAGVVSFGLVVCGGKEAPGVLANVANFNSWISMRARILSIGSFGRTFPNIG